MCIEFYIEYQLVHNYIYTKLSIGVNTYRLGYVLEAGRSARPNKN